MKKILIACIFALVPFCVQASYMDSTGGIVVVHSNGSYTEYDPAANTDVARGNALLSAKAALADGDVIYMSGHTFDIGTNQVIDLSIDNTKTVSIHGTGTTTSKIKVASTDVSEIIGFGINSNISDFSLIGTMDSSDALENGETNNRQTALGSIASSVLFQNVFVKNFYSETGSDGLYVTTGSGNLKIVNSSINTNWDTFIWCSTGRVDIYDSSISANATGVAGSSRGPWHIDECGPIYLWNTNISVRGGSTVNYGIDDVWGPPNEIYMYGGSVHASGAGALDIHNPNNAFIGVSPSASYTTSSGTITAISEATKTVPSMPVETWSMTNPTLSTPQTSSVQKTSVQVSSAITSSSAVYSKQRGFRYGTDGATWSTTTPETGDFGTDTFTASISGLACETTYVVQSFAQNATGWGYSSSKSFTTASCVDAPVESSSRSGVYGSTARVETAVPATVPVVPGCPRGYVCTPKPDTSPSMAPGTSNPISTFFRNLGLGSGGQDVKELQKHLNAKGFIIALSGPGSPGNESTYFGNRTQAALAAYQKAMGLPATGFFGPMTRGKMKSGL